MSTQLRYSREELLRDHDFAAPHRVGDVRLHGGFLADGAYQPPRALVREAAFGRWEDALRSRGGAPLDATSALLEGIRTPTPAQQRVLLRHGLPETFWNGLTITGKVEARGRLLAEMTFPELQPVIVDDISEMAIGHLNEGLLVAHGLDEGGVPAEGIGGHDVMWFALRDLVMDPGDFVDVEPLENIGRPESDRRVMPELDEPIERMISFLCNLLIIEFRAEIGFADTQEILRSEELFVDRRADAELAAELVERIRRDEEIHVRSLCLYLGEMRSVTFRTVDGGTIGGDELIDRIWDDLVRWATVEQPAAVAAQQRQLIEERVLAHPDGAAVLAEFDAAA